MQDYFENKKVLITGIAGFAGSHLAEKLTEYKCRIFGFKKPRTDVKNIYHILRKVKILPVDIANEKTVKKAVDKIKPDIVFHLAAIPSVQQAAANPMETYNVNINGTMYLLESLKKNIPEAFHFASSANVYGKVSENEIPIKETHALKPNEYYSYSKVAAEFLCYSYYEMYGIPVVITRAFPHAGLRCPENLVTTKIAKETAEAKLKKKKELTFGNLDVVRDISDVRDVVLGYISTVYKGKRGDVYNICSGKGYRLREIVEIALDFLNLKEKVRINIDSNLLRKNDIPVLIGDYTKAKDNLNWKPMIPFEETLYQMINYYLKTF